MVAAFLLLQSPSEGASFPTMPVKIIVPYAPGGSGDIAARVLGERASAELGQAILVDNRSGAGGILGLRAAARAKPDGYTLVQMATGHVTLPSLIKDVGYDLAHDFTPVFGTTSTPLVFAVNARSDVHSFGDLVAEARSMPGGLKFASGGTGSVSHLVAADLAQRLKMRATQVPYRGFSEAVTALLGGQVQFICATTADAGELARTDAIRVLAVASARRAANLPDVPTMAELGFDNFEAASWNAYLAPAGTPSTVINRLYDAYAKAANDPMVRDQLGKLGITITVMNGDQLAKFIANETIRWRRVIEENQIRIEE
jgi:tripartite-type tricarboxylate transporter receptor subunit TctC